MLNVRNILFPTNFTPNTYKALNFTSDLAVRYTARLHILHVVETLVEESLYPGYSDEDARDYYECASQAAREWMDPLVARAIRRGVVLPERAVMCGEASRCIVSYALAKDADLIVMPTRTRHGEDAYTVSTVVHSVLRSAPCPVLTLRGLAIPDLYTKPGGDVVVAIDFSSYSRLALEYGIKIAQIYGARLHALHVVPEDRLPACYMPEEKLDFEQLVIERNALNALRYYIRETANFAVPIAARVQTKNPALGIADYAHSVRARLIVMGTHGEGGYDVAGPGGTASKVIRISECPVLTVRHKRRRLAHGMRRMELVNEH